MGKAFIRQLVLLLCVAIMALTGCKKYTEIKPTSFKVESISPQGLRSIYVEMSVGVSNPAGQISFSDMFAELEKSGKVLGRLTIAPFVLEAKSDTVYRLKGRVNLTDDLTVIQALNYLRKPELLNDAVIHITAKAQLKSGLHKTFTYRDIPVENLLKLLKQ